MPGYVNSPEMAMLNSVLDEVCRERGSSPAERDYLAAQIMTLFLSGVSEPADLLATLRSRQPDWSPSPLVGSGI